MFPSVELIVLVFRSFKKGGYTFLRPPCGFPHGLMDNLSLCRSPTKCRAAWSMPVLWQSPSRTIQVNRCIRLVGHNWPMIDLYGYGPRPTSRLSTSPFPLPILLLIQDHALHLSLATTPEPVVTILQPPSHPPVPSLPANQPPSAHSASPPHTGGQALEDCLLTTCNQDFHGCCPFR